jgi:hypothetical protein
VQRVQKQDSSSSEEQTYRAYGVPQVVAHHSYGGSIKPYAGPKVTREQTEYLHRDAIEKQRGLIALGQAIAARGPAPADPNYKEPGVWGSGSDSSDDSSDSGEAKRYYYSGGAAAGGAAAGVQEVTHQYYEQKPWTGPKVTSAETEFLHRDAIALQKGLIRKQAELISRARDDSDDSSYEEKGADDAQLNRDLQNEKALLARQEAEVQTYTMVSCPHPITVLSLFRIDYFCYTNPILAILGFLFVLGKIPQNGQ